MTPDWRSLGRIPADQHGPVFAAPWQAQAFAITMQLHARGVFEWHEWASSLARAIEAAQQRGDPDLGDTYYLHWLDALESLVREKGLASEAVLKSLREAWADAAEHTPHGHAIELEDGLLERLIGQE